MSFLKETKAIVNETVTKLVNHKLGMRGRDPPHFKDAEIEEGYIALYTSCVHLGYLYSRQIRKEVGHVNITPGCISDTFHQLAGGLFQDAVD